MSDPTPEALARGRALLLAYFAERGGARGPAMAPAGGRVQAPTATPYRGALRSPEGPDNAGVEAAGLSATRTHATESRRHREGRPPPIAGMCGGAVRRAIAERPALEQGWIALVYGRRRNMLDYVRAELWHSYLVGGWLHRRRAPTITAVASLLDMQLDATRQLPAWMAWTDRRPDVFAATCTAEMWREKFRPHARRLRVITLGLDATAVLGVYNSVNRRGFIASAPKTG